MRHAAGEYQGEGWKLQPLIVIVSLGVTSQHITEQEYTGYLTLFVFWHSYRQGSCCQSHVSTLRRAETLSSSACRELDSAMLRRLEKRILVDLPSEEARRVMIQHWLPPVSSSGGVKLRTELDYSLLSQVGGAAAGTAVLQLLLGHSTDPGLGQHLGVLPLPHTQLGRHFSSPEAPARGTLVGHGAEHGTGTWKSPASRSSACKMVCPGPLCWASFSALNTGRLPATADFITVLTKLGALQFIRVMNS